MAVEERAEIYPPEAEDLLEFLPGTDCGKCGFSDCLGYAEVVLENQVDPRECPELNEAFAAALASIAGLKKEPIPYNVMMEQVPCELIGINQPDEKSPLLVTCNFRETVRILREVLESCGTRAFLLPTFTHGYSVDNAVHEKMFKAVEVWKAMTENAVEGKVGGRELVIPGLAESERNAIRQMTRWNVQVGPVSGFLLPLFILENEGT